MVTTLGAASIPLIVVITITGYLLCLLLAELSAMMPERTGGAPSYAYPAYRDAGRGAAKHINGITSWMYWLGWFPVAPLNMILASFYLADRFGLDTTSGFTPINTPIAWWTLGISIVGILLFFIPAYMGIRVGAGFATVLGIISMVPLTFLAVGSPLHRRRRLGRSSRASTSSTAPASSPASTATAGSPCTWATLPADLERDRHGGRRLLHRRDARTRRATRRSR